jgi:tetratricopeptide (TPR) repeat protein
VVVIAVLSISATARAQSAKDKETAREHFEQAEIFLKAGVYDKAIEEYQASYTLMPTAHLLLFNIGLAYESWGKRNEARDHYQRYLTADPNGAKATEAKARSIAIDRAIENEKIAEARRQKEEEEQRKAREAAEKDEAARRAEEAQRVGVGGGANPAGGDVTTTDKPAEGISWLWVAAGAAALGAGVLIDAVPESGSNGKLDGTDFIPVGFYGLGGTLMVTGFF